MQNNKSNHKAKIVHFPNKLLYLTKVKDQWSGLKQIKELTVFDRELKAFDDFLLYVSIQTKLNLLVNIIHIGVGNGCEIPIVKNHIGQNNIKSYNLVDISIDFLDNIKGLLGVSNSFVFNFFQKDVSSDDTIDFYRSISSSENNFYILGGCGSLIEDDSVLKNIYMSMQPNDYLILTLEYYSKDSFSDVIKEYSHPDVIRLFSSNLRQIGFFDVDDKFFDIKIDDSGYLTVSFEYDKWLLDNADSARPIILTSNIPDRIIVFRSLKKDFNLLHDHFHSFGFTIVKEKKYSDYKCGAFLLNKGI